MNLQITRGSRRNGRHQCKIHVPDPSASSPSSTSDGLVGLGGRQTRDAHEVPSEEEEDDDDDDEWGGEPCVGVDVE